MSRSEWTLGILWVVATTIGWVVGFFVCETLKAFFESLSHSDGLVIGFFVGLTQWLVLRGRLNHTGWWILLSTIGFGVGKAMGASIADAVPGAVGLALDGAVIGGLLGILQWLVLRRQVAVAGRWVAASALAWAGGWSIISIIGEGASGPTGMAYLVGAVGASAAGVITAASVVWLLRRPYA